MMPPTVLVMMGVSGSGKTTIATALADNLGWEFQEGDDLHPAENRIKMQGGVALDDVDRAPWLAGIKVVIDRWLQHATPGVITCSALKRRYRDMIIAGRDAIGIVYLHTSREQLARQLAARRGHFMPAALLDSQLAVLEPPTAAEHPIMVYVSGDTAGAVAAIRRALHADPRR